MDITIQDFAGLMIVGALLTAVVSWIKAKWGTEGTETKVLTIVLALVVGGLYVWLRSTSFFPTVVLVLTTSSTVYALFVNKS